ncbi:rad2 superfamily protein mus201 [Rhynchophorus ferrugineus]|uniref:rad2 superfamily protein mus201 n=1 Tax=Rhynchophorus ferrugineus TaxID=354439 RepID=UPI003FCC7FED
MYQLPPNPPELESTLSDSDDESESYSETTSDSSPSKNWDLHTIDMNSVHFKSLPVDVRHEILSDLKETRKQSSWGRIHELPTESNDFSTYQMRRLLKRQAVQSALEEAEKEMGGKCLSLGELELVLKDEGVLTNDDVGKRIASDNVTKYVLLKDLKAAKDKLEDTKQNIETDIVINQSTEIKSKADIEYEEELQKAIALSLEEPKQDKKTLSTKKANPAEFSFLEDFKKSDFALSSSDEELESLKPSKIMSSVQGYMQEYSGLTPAEIDKIMNNNLKKNHKMDTPSLKSPANVQGVSRLIEKMDTASHDCGSGPSKNIVTLTHNDSGFSSSKNNSPVQQDDLEKSIQEKAEIEFMSSSDSENDEEETCKKLENGLEININISEEYYDQDDLFSDVFIADSSLTDPSKNINEQDIQKSQQSSQEKNLSDSINITEKLIDITNSIQIDNNLIEPGLKENTKKEVKEEKPIFTQEIRKEDEKPDILIEKSNLKPELTAEQLIALKDELHKEKVELQIQKSTKERIASNITDKIYQEAQELLELFGVPYIIAPMEAEAQCAFLEQIELTNGTVTDDSDIWLFGAQTVYKNFFNENKYVKEFRAENINHHFKLTRDQMILFALLVGSDYTIGLQGVGPVTAMEILACFPPTNSNANEFRLSHSELLSGLKEFRSWFTKGKTSGPGRNILKNKLKNVKFTESFPSTQVVQAYLEPCVETSNEPFSWGKPNGPVLIEFAMEKFGWTKMKSEHILNPVLKRLDEVKHQKTIKDYFKTTYKIHSEDATSGLSKRVKSAITNMGRDQADIIAEELESGIKKPQKKRSNKDGNGSKTTAPEFNRTHSEVKLIGSIGKKRTNEPVSQIIEDKKPRLKSTLNQIESSANNAELPKNQPDGGDDISEKIKSIRKRRVLKQAKATAVKEVKVKQKKEAVQKNPMEIIPENLKDDDEVSLLSKVLSESSERVKEIKKSVKKDIEMLDMQSTPSTSKRAPIKIKPKKVLIPQKEKEKNTLLRNKLKAIETFRRSKRGPGFVPKKGNSKRQPKDNADLSENSSDE